MKNLKNHNIKNKKILFRADLNVPVVNGIITDTSRIKAIKSSIEILTSNKNKIFLLAHFGRPNGEVVEKYSLNFILWKENLFGYFFCNFSLIFKINLSRSKAITFVLEKFNNLFE